jgi:hypothetical protein
MSDALADFYALMRLPGRPDARAWQDSYAAIAQPAQPGGLPPKATEEQYARMPAAERIAYARSFPQPMNGGPRR